MDVGDDALMRARSWRWLEVRILGLLDRPAQVEPWTGHLHYGTRLQYLLLPQPRGGGKTAER